MAIKTYEEVVREDAPEIFLRLDEASGTDAADSTRFGRDFTHTGSPTLDQAGPAGIGGKAILYALGDHSQRSDNMPITAYPFTFAFWARHSSSSTSANEIAVKLGAGNLASADNHLYADLRTDGSNNLSIVVLVRTSGSTSFQFFYLPNHLKGEWVYVVVQYVSATERNVYANGSFRGSATTSKALPSGMADFTINLDASSDASTGVGQGLIAEPVYYNYQLPARRIRNIHALGMGFTNTDSYGYAVMTEGPSLYATLGDASGNAVDSSGWQRDLTVAGAPTRGATSPLSEDSGDDATTFDGTDDAFALAGDDLDITAYPVVVKGFLKAPATLANTTSYCRVMFGDDGTEDNYFGIDLTTDGSGNLQARGLLETGGTADHITGSPVLAADQFYHVALRCVSATERYLEVNGVQVGSDTTSRAFGSNINDVVLGRDLAASPNFYAGTIGQVGIFGRDIGEIAVRNQYAKAKQYLGDDFKEHTLRKCPLAYYRMGESSGTAAANETEFPAAGTYAGTGPTLGETSALVDDADTAVQFNGTDDQMTAPFPGTPTYPITLEALVRLPDTPSSSTSYIRVGITDASGTHKMVAGLKTDGNTKIQAFAEEVGTSTGTINNSCGGAVANYHHLMVEFISDTSRKVWLNGIELEEETTSVSITLADLDTICVGVEDLGTDAWYAGYCDEFVVYQRQLSTDEKRDQYLAGLGYMDPAALGGGDAGLIQEVLEDGPALLWPQNESAGTDALSADRFGRDGAYANGFTLGQDGPHANYSAVNYDGTDGEAAYADANDVPIKGYPFVISSVLKSPASLANSTDYAFFGVADSGGTDDVLGVQLRTDGSGNIFARGHVRIGGTDDHIDQNSGTGLSVQNNKFLYVALVCRSATDRELYVQGRSSGTDATSYSFPSTLDTVAAGKLPSSSPSFYAGDQMMGSFFDYELTESQILKHSMAIRGVFESDNPYLYEVGQLVPAVHYRFNEASGAPSDLLGLRDLALADAPTQSDSGGPIDNSDDDGSIQFDGSNDAASVADDAQVTDFPMAVYGWLRTPSSPGTSAVFSQGGMGDDGTGDNGAQVALETDGSSNVTPSALFKTGGTTDNIQPSSPVLEADVWHFVMFVLRSATEREIYANGAPLSTETTSRTFPSNMDDIVFGRDFLASPNFRSGYFAEGGVLTSDVSDAEALALYLSAFEALGEVVIPMGDISVTGTMGVLVDMPFTKDLNFATLGRLGSIGVRVELKGGATRDFRNVQTFVGAMGIVTSLDGIVSAEFTREREGKIEVVAQFSSPVTFEQIKSGNIGVLVSLLSETDEGTDPVTDDINEAIVIRAPKIDYTFKASKHPTGRRL